MTWCGFIDLLGTKESANASESKLRQGLSHLHSALRANFAKLDGGVCYAFSDGAFFQAPDIDRFAEFYVELRKSLFSNGHFFKCAIVRESLQVDTSFSDEGGRIPLSESKFVSIRFGGGAPRAYIDQDRFKGVGSILSGHEVLSEGERKHLVRSFYVTDNQKSTREYFDVRFTDEETGSTKSDDDTPWEERLIGEQTESDGHSFLEIFLHEVAKVKSRAKRYTRYYLPTLVSMVRSIDFSEFDYDGEEWRSSPYLIDQILISHRFDKIFAGSAGYEFLYWAIVDEIYRQRPDLSEMAKNELMICLLSRRNVFSEIDAIPNHVADSAVKDDLIGRKARFDAMLGRRVS